MIRGMIKWRCFRPGDMRKERILYINKQYRDYDVGWNIYSNE